MDEGAQSMLGWSMRGHVERRGLRQSTCSSVIANVTLEYLACLRLNGLVAALVER